MSCERCGGEFAVLKDKRSRHPKSYCKGCGAGAHWAQGADVERWAGDTAVHWPDEAPDPNPFWVGFGSPRINHHAGCASRRERSCDCEPTINQKDETRWCKFDLRADLRTGDGFYDVDGTTWLSAKEMLGASLNFGRKRAFRINDTTSRSYSQELNGDAAADGDLLAEGGFVVRRDGTTGQPVGRPAGGITDPATIDALFRVAANTTGGLADFRWCMRVVGRPPAHVQETRAQLARGIVVLRQKGASVAVMAERLDCDHQAVYRLVKAGLKVTQNSPNNEEEEKPMIASDEQIALDAERLQGIVFVLAAIAERLLTRFPKDSEIQAAVDRFLQQSLN